MKTKRTHKQFICLFMKIKLYRKYYNISTEELKLFLVTFD